MCDCEKNGFFNVPVECEDRECAECKFDNDARRELDCPYIKTKPELKCTCGKTIVLSELLSNDWDDYAGKCECGLAWQVRDVSALYEELEDETDG